MVARRLFHAHYLTQNAKKDFIFLMKTKNFGLLAAVLLFLSIWAVFNLNKEDDNAIHIAFVGPLSGEDERIGNSMVQAIQLYLDDYNQQSGNKHRKIILDTFDDQNDSSEAQKAADDIVKSRAVAVIGHNYSSCSIAGGKVYENKIAAISPASTQNKLTANNEWYFRTIFDNNLQSSFLANYAKEYLLPPDHDAVSLIYTDDAYGTDLAQIFGSYQKKTKEGCTENGCKWMLSLKGNELEQRITQIVSDLQKNQNKAGLISLATPAYVGVKLVKSIKDAGIKNLLIAPDSYASQTFYKGFENETQNPPGYYTDGIYVSIPFMLETASKYANNFHSKYEKKYQEQLPWQAFYAVDAAIMLVEAIKQADIQGQLQTLSVDRKKIQENLATKFNTLEQAVEGTTGLNYFNNRNASKPASMGIYKNEKLFAAFDQLQEVRHSGEIDSALSDKYVSIGDKQFHKTDVVYTGVQFNEISDFDPNTITYTLDFYLWFIAKAHINLQDIEFLNAVKPIQLSKPLINESIDGKTYHLYKVNGRFKENARHSKHQVLFTNQQALGVSFHHRALNRTALIYVIDSWGMDLTNDLGEFQNQQRLNFLTKDWAIEDISFFQSTFKKKALGNPKYLTPTNRTEYEYSLFHADILVDNNAYVYHAIIPSQFAVDFLIFTGVITLLLIFVSYKKNINIQQLKYLWFLQGLFAVLLLISSEVVAGEIVAGRYWWFTIRIDKNEVQIILTIFQMLWWIIPAILLSVATERFLWMSLEEKTGRSIPNLMRFSVSAIIYILALFGIIAFVFERPITSLLATGGLFAGIVGFAVQFNLSNILSGIALSIERSFRVSDWVKIGNFDEGQVVDMNWRATKIQTRKKYILSLPNSTVSKSDIHNFSYPNNQYWLQCTVHLDPKYDPRRVEEVLINAILSVEEGVVKDVKPIIRLESIATKEFANNLIASYVIFFKTENYQYKALVLKIVWQHIWTHLSQAGIITPAAEIQPSKNETTVALTPAKLEEVFTKSKLQNMIVGL